MSKDLELIRNFLRIKGIDLEDELKLLAEKEEVLDIIFEKEVDIRLVKHNGTCNGYNSDNLNVNYSNKKLTEQEFRKIKRLWDTLNKH